MRILNIFFRTTKARPIENRLIPPLLPVDSTEAEFTKRTILLRFLGIILRVHRLEVFIYNVYITNQFQNTLAQGGEGE
jgi:hypothetical protein